MPRFDGLLVCAPAGMGAEAAIRHVSRPAACLSQSDSRFAEVNGIKLHAI